MFLNEHKTVAIDSYEYHNGEQRYYLLRPGELFLWTLHRLL